MLVVRLLTSDLEDVADVELPPIVDRAMPEMVMWMKRCFLKHGRFSDGHTFYIESYWVSSLTPPPGLPRSEPGDTRPDLPHMMRKTNGQ
jgi:hypothetical protein